MKKSYAEEGEEEEGTPSMNNKGKKRRYRPQGPSPKKKIPITLSDYAEEQNMDRAAEEKLLEDCNTGKPPAGYTIVDPSHPDMQGKEVLFQEIYLVPVVEVPISSGPGGLRAQLGSFMSGRNELKDVALKLETTKEENRALERKQELALQEAKNVREGDKEKRSAKLQKQQMKMQSQQMKLQLAMMKKMGVLASDSDKSSDDNE